MWSSATGRLAQGRASCFPPGVSEPEQRAASEMNKTGAQGDASWLWEGIGWGKSVVAALQRLLWEEGEITGLKDGSAGLSEGWPEGSGR